METDVKIVVVDYQEACRRSALTSSEQECQLGPYMKVLPRMRYTPGSRPGITGADPLGLDVGSQDLWEFPFIWNGLTKLEKKIIMTRSSKGSVGYL